MTMTEGRPLVVVQSYADPARSGFMNPFKVLLVDSLPDARIRAEYFRWRAALLSRFDVLHIHWPEHLIRSSSRWRQLAKVSAMAVLLLRLRMRRTAIVRTVHNVRPHEAATRLEDWMLERLNTMTTAWVIMNDTTLTPDLEHTVLIPHGHYRDWYHPRSGVKQLRGRLLTFGLIRQYKGIEGLVRAFRSLPDGDRLSLAIAGKPDSAATGESVARMAGDDPRIELDLRYLDDEELTTAIQEAEAVILPYREMHNSGSALLALSLDRPIVVPSSATTEQLVEEFGDEWVITYQGELDDRVLADALDAVRTRTRGVEGVDMRTRDWASMGLALAAVYEDAVSRRRRRTHARATS